MLYEQLPFIFIISAGAVVVTVYWVRYMIKSRDRIKYGNLQKDLIFNKRVDKIGNLLSKVPVLNKLLSDLTLKLSVFNSSSLQVNMRYSVIAVLTFAIVFVILSAVLQYLFYPLWYIALSYMLLFASIICLLLLFASSYANKRFLDHMPETLRVLSARYASVNNISKCIGVSISDFHKSIRGDMVRIYDALKLNDMEKIRSTFSSIDAKYSNEHMTLLLELIWHAYYNGGDEVIRGQFNNMLEDIIEDIENKKDLSAASLSYIGMGALFCAAVPLTRMFNESMLGIESRVFYSSREGILLGFLYYLFITGIMFLIIIIERS